MDSGYLKLRKVEVNIWYDIAFKLIYPGLLEYQDIATQNRMDLLHRHNDGWFGWFMVFYATFNNISVISWRSILLVEETEVPGGNHRTVASD